MILTCFTLFIVYLSYKYLKYLRNLSLAQNWPGIRQPIDSDNPLVMLGISPKWFTPWNRLAGFHYKWDNFYKKYGKDVLTCITPERISYFVADAQYTKEITTTNKQFFPKPTFFYTVLAIFGQNVVTTEDEVWRRHRKVASFGFSEKNNKLVHQESIKASMGMVRELQRVYKETGTAAVVDVVKYTLKVALCVISTAAFGFQTEWEHEDVPAKGYQMSFFSALEEVSSRPVPVVMCPRWALNIPVFNLPRLGSAIRDFKKYMKEAIDRGKQIALQKEDSKQGDLFSALIRGAIAEQTGASLALSDEELLGNIYMLMVAGHGLLALHQDIQQDFYNEICSVFGKNDAPEYEDIGSLKLGNAIINETLRMFPIVTVIPKWAPQDTTLGDIPIPAGSIVNLHVTGLHYNERFWKNPHEFNPHRFLNEYNKDAFIPFSDGARGCLGKRFAQIEAIVVLAVLLRHFEVTPIGDEQGLLDADIHLTLIPAKPVNLKFTPRK